VAAAGERPRVRLSARAEAQAAARRVHGAPAEEAADTDYAGLVTRTLAFAVDAAVINVVAVTVGVVAALVFSVLPESDELRSVVVAVGGVLYIAWTIGYFVTFWTTTGETLGNRVMRIRVMRADGSRLRPRHALVRLFGIVAGLPLFLGYIPILITERRRGLQDFLAGTVVRVSTANRR
jgi:uncharacterized RDD family membrane protein YckC